MMKKKLIVWIWVCILCALCVSCGSQETKDPDEDIDSSSAVSSQDQDPDSETEKDGTVNSGTVNADSEDINVEEINLDDEDLKGGNSGEEDSEEWEEISVSAQGKKRITYMGRRNSVIYVTSVDALPDYEELKQYDEAYFKEHALLLVTETVNSGSIDVSIQSVRVGRSVGTVTLSRVAPDPKDAASTTDMATWLLWAEVDQGLDCQWTVANPAMKSNTEAY